MASVILIPEITQRIIYFLIYGLFKPPGLDAFMFPYSERWGLLPGAGRYAVVNRMWQDVIERKTFANLRLDLGRLSQVTSIITPRRRRYVRTIRLDVVLPRPGPLRSPETDAERLRNNRVLQATFEAFMQPLSQWNAAEVHHEGVKLSFEAFAPGDPLHDEERPHSPRRWLRRAAWARKNAKSVLELTDPERIAQYPPVVAIVEVAGKPTSLGRHISPVAICVLLARLPAAKRATVHWWNFWRFSRMRNDLADALSQINHPMDEFGMGDISSIPMSHSQSPLASVFSGEGDDRLSKSIHILSRRLKVLDINDILVGDEIFLPRAVLTEPQWSRLVIFNLSYPPVNPSGEWLFLPDPNKSDPESEAALSDDDSSDSSHQEVSIFTLGVAAPAMKQFYLDAARAALQMPALKHMTLVAQLQLGENWHKFWYYAEQSVAKVVWTSSSGFVPEDEVLGSWREVSKKHLKAGLEVELLDDENAI
ncbi:hypothetical protein PT974_12344 [Cladobotryum mycophilum]|uniref:DUF6546 domain-containing protein n=1 Tax=Cladobotryum mycophilum TaxID=491253 RepID=A0ABR0S8A9_9HYPO